MISSGPIPLAYCVCSSADAAYRLPARKELPADDELPVAGKVLADCSCGVVGKLPSCSSVSSIDSLVARLFCWLEVDDGASGLIAIRVFSSILSISSLMSPDYRLNNFKLVLRGPRSGNPEKSQKEVTHQFWEAPLSGLRCQ